jgi:prevent-host-death family protein
MKNTRKAPVVGALRKQTKRTIVGERRGLAGLTSLWADSPIDRWQLQDAKAELSTLVQAALDGRPQCITRRGKDAVVVVSYEAFCEATRPKGSLVDFFLNSPLAGSDIEFERNRAPARDDVIFS